MLRGFLKIVVLKAISESPKSGYSLMKYVEDNIGSKPSPGSMYPLLEKLESEKLISVKTKGRAKEYTITAEGKKRLSLIEEKRAECMANVAENMKLMETLTGEKQGIHAEAFKAIRKGELPLKELNPELDKFRSQLFRLMKSGKLKTKREEIKKILAKAQKELKTV